MAFGKIIQSESIINFAVWLDRIQSRDRYPMQRHNNYERKLMKKTKNKIVKKKNKQVTAYQKALNKKLKQDFPGIKVKNLGDGMSEISFG